MARTKTRSAKIKRIEQIAAEGAAIAFNRKFPPANLSDSMTVGKLGSPRSGPTLKNKEWVVVFGGVDGSIVSVYLDRQLRLTDIYCSYANQ